MRFSHFLLAVTLLSPLPVYAAPATEARVVADYATLVHTTYADTLAAGLALKKSIAAFLAQPTEANLAAARKSWVAARVPYSRTEAFRFYDGPIDLVNGKPGPEAHLNSWPLNEAYIDSVKGNPTSGIINDLKQPLTKESLTKANQATDEANVATGYHAVEFLLWGQDFNLSGPGNRPASDYAGKTEISKRRRTYLSLVTDMLVEDVRLLEREWVPGKDNYAKRFLMEDPKAAIGKILTGLATLSVHELGAERMNDSLMSGDQEDEEDCFSDNSKNDMIGDAEGIRNVMLAQYQAFKGASLMDLLAQKNPKAAGVLLRQLDKTQKDIAAIPAPIDAKVLATPEGSPGRAAMKAGIDDLLEQGTLILEAGKALGVPVEIVSDDK